MGLGACQKPLKPKAKMSYTCLYIFTWIEDEGVEMAEKGEDEEVDEATGPAKQKHGKKERAILQAKLTKLAIQIGYGGMAIAIMTVVVLITRYSITNFVYGNTKLTTAIFQPLVKYLITGNISGSGHLACHHKMNTFILLNQQDLKIQSRQNSQFLSNNT